MQKRYPNVHYWTLWNEPNYDKYFSPQPPLINNSPVDEYADLVLINGANALRSASPYAVIIASHIATSENGGDATAKDDNWGYTSMWLSGWINRLMTTYQQYFDKWAIDCYGTSTSDDQSARTAVGNVYLMEQQYAVYKPIWLTEFNFRNGTNATDTDAQRTIANATCKEYKYATWERSFFFKLFDNAPADNYISDDFGILGWINGNANVEKPFLYPAYQAIVTNSPTDNYGCN